MLVEAQFKVRDLEQQLKSSLAIRGDLLNKAIEAQQKLQAPGSTILAATLPNPENTRVPLPSSHTASEQSLTVKGLKEQCNALKKQCDQLRVSLNESKRELENKVTESKMHEPSQNWYKAELRSAKKTIRQLRTLLQAKEEKIELMSKLREIPKRSITDLGF